MQSAVYLFPPPDGFVLMLSVSSIAPVVLAAGDSMRMGYPKALLPLGADVFITRILGVMRKSGLPRPVIVLGRKANIIRPKIKDWPADICVNPDPDRGQLSSIQLALLHLAPEFEAVMIWPVDQPAVSEKLVNRLIRLFVDSGCAIALPRCSGRRGHPAIFHRSIFNEFLEAPLEEGPKKILLRHENETAILPTEETGTILDIDTPADYQALTGEDVKTALARVNSTIS